MSLLKWYDEDEDKKEEQPQVQQIASVQKQWQPTHENNQTQSPTQKVEDRTAGNYLFSAERQQAEEAERQRRAEEARQRAIAEQERINAHNAEVARQNQLAQQNQARQAQQPAQESQENYNQRMNQFINQKVEQERQNWNNSLDFVGKIATGLGIQKGFNENQARANARATFVNNNTDWNDQAQVAKAQQTARAAVDVNNFTRDKNLVGDSSSSAFRDMFRPANHNGYDLEIVQQQIEQGLANDTMTPEQANALMEDAGMFGGVITPNSTVLDPETGQFRRKTMGEYATQFTNGLRQVTTKPLSEAGNIIAKGVEDITGITNLNQADKTPNRFDFTDPTDYLRALANIPTGMVRGITGSADKIVEGTGDVVGGTLDQEHGQAIGGLAKMASGAIDVAGLNFGGSGTLLKAVKGEVVERSLPVVAQLVKDGVLEGTEEAVQGFLDQVSENDADLSKIDYNQLKEAFIQGGVAGGIMGGLGKANTAFQEKAGEFFDKSPEIAQNLQNNANQLFNQPTPQLATAGDTGTLSNQFIPENDQTIRSDIVAGQNATGFENAENKFDRLDGYQGFEIDDSKAQIIQKPTGNTLADWIDHPDMFREYPELRDVQIKTTRNARSKTAGYFSAEDNSITLNLSQPISQLRDTLLHEIQHWVQHKEGFASGGSPNTAGLNQRAFEEGRSFYDVLRDYKEMQANVNSQIRKYKQELQQMIENGVDFDTRAYHIQRANAHIAQMKRELTRYKNYGTNAKQRAEIYQKLGGEAEARAVETRSNMTAEERANTPFYDSYDVPLDETLQGAEAGTKPPIPTDNLPDDMADPTPPPVETPEPTVGEPTITDDNPVETPTNSQSDAKATLDRVISRHDVNDIPQRQEIARAFGLDVDANTPLSEVLTEVYHQNFEGNQKIKNIFDKLVEHETKLEDVRKQYNEIQSQYAKALKQGVEPEDLARQRNKLQKEIGDVVKDMNGLNDVVLRKSGLGKRAEMAISNLISYRKVNMLLSASSIERNITQEVVGNLRQAVSNPIRTLKALPVSIRDAGYGAKNSLTDWSKESFKARPVRYTMSNLYEKTMAGTQALADMRIEPIRDTLADSIANLVNSKLGEKDGKMRVTPEQIKQAGGAEFEMVARALASMENDQINGYHGKKLIETYANYIDTGNTQARQQMMKLAEGTKTVSAKLAAQSNIKGDNFLSNSLRWALDYIVPFSNTATNHLVNTLYRLDPRQQSMIDTVKSQFENGNKMSPQKAGRLLKSAIVNYGTALAIPGLIAGGVIGWNDDDEDQSKPRGAWIKIGDGYTTPRALGLDLPITGALVADRMFKDIMTGKINTKKYVEMMSNALPYAQEMKGAVGFGEQLTDEKGAEYALKSAGINTLRTLTPLANNNLYAWLKRNGGETPNQKSIYDKDFGKWTGNMLKRAFPVNGDSSWNELADSRDKAGRVRTVDIPGAFGKKPLNDQATAEFNQAVIKSLDISKKYNLGDSTNDVWDTYKEKNSHFRSAINSILHGSDNGGDNAFNQKTLLEKDGKIAELAKQLRTGFLTGETESDNLMIGEEYVYSDVSLPNKDGSKNSTKPLSALSIRNAIIQKDLSKDEQEKLLELSTAKKQLGETRGAGQISKDQYQAERQRLAGEERAILDKSKSYQKYREFLEDTEKTGFFDENGYGSTKSGQIWFWNSLNAMLGDKGKTPAAEYKNDTDSNKTGSGRRSGGRKGSGISQTDKSQLKGFKGIDQKVGSRKLEVIKNKRLARGKTSISLSNQIKKDKSRDYSGRKF